MKHSSIILLSCIGSLLFPLWSGKFEENEPTKSSPTASRYHPYKPAAPEVSGLKKNFKCLKCEADFPALRACKIHLWNIHRILSDNQPPFIQETTLLPVIAVKNIPFTASKK